MVRRDYIRWVVIGAFISGLLIAASLLRISSHAVSRFCDLPLLDKTDAEVVSLLASVHGCKVYRQEATIVAQIERRRGLVTTTYSRTLHLRDGRVVEVIDNQWNTGW